MAKRISDESRKQTDVDSETQVSSNGRGEMIPSPAAPSWTMVKSLGEAVTIAKLVAEGNALPDCRNAGVALLKILAGAEMGFGPFASLTGVDVIEGKPSVGAHLKAAAIRRSERYDYSIVEQDEEGTVCEVAFWERTDFTGGTRRKFCAGWHQQGSVRMTRELADARGLSKGKSGTKSNWATSPADMLFARCITKGYKRYCPDISGGARTYDADELDQGQEPESVPHGFNRNVVEPVVDAEFTTSGNGVETPPRADGVSTKIPREQEIAEEVVARFGDLVKQLSLDPAKVRARLKQKYGTEAFRELRQGQAQEAVDQLERALDKQSQEQPAG